MAYKPQKKTSKKEEPKEEQHVIQEEPKVEEHAVVEEQKVEAEAVASVPEIKPSAVIKPAPVVKVTPKANISAKPTIVAAPTIPAKKMTTDELISVAFATANRPKPKGYSKEAADKLYIAVYNAILSDELNPDKQDFIEIKAKLFNEMFGVEGDSLPRDLRDWLRNYPGVKSPMQIGEGENSFIFTGLSVGKRGDFVSLTLVNDTPAAEGNGEEAAEETPVVAGEAVAEAGAEISIPEESIPEEQVQ